MKLRGRTMWLIGASSGIGAALAPALAAEGVVLALSARREEELNRVAGRCTGGTRPLVKPLDVTQKDQIDRTYRALVETWGKVDIVFYNAGTWADARVESFDTEGALNQIDVVYLGLVRVVGAAMPDMIARGNGDIIGMASLAGYRGLPRAAAYSSAKNAVNAFLQSIRIELNRHGVGVVTINPGFVRTPLTDRNTFRMPFLLTTDQAVEAIMKGLREGDEEIHFPRRLSWPLKVFAALPRPAFEAIARRFMTKA